MPNSVNTVPFNAWPHRVAVALCCATFPLIWAGGLVTTYDAGMAVPDWPSTFGYNIWLYPWSTWFFGPWDLFIEHSHRLLGTLVGLLAILFVVVVYRSADHRWMRPLAWGCLAGVVLQGGLGGARVLLDERHLAMIHGCVGPCFFAFTAALAVMAGADWRQTSPPALAGTGSRSTRGTGNRQPATAAGLSRLATLTAGLAFLQLVLGAQLRHISIMAGPGQFRVFVFFHLIVAFALLAHALLLAVRSLRLGPSSGKSRLPAVALALFMVLQFVLGPATWVVNYGWPQWVADMPFAVGHTIQAKSLVQAMIVTAHVAVGSLVLASAAVVATRAVRLARVEVTAVGSTAMFVGLAT